MKIIYAVIDTNVVVSSFLKKGSIPNEVVELALNGQIVPVLSNEILNEYREVLSRTEFELTDDIVSGFIDDISQRAVFLDRTPSNEKFIDLDDAVFYEVVMTARERDNAYLITGNLKHYPRKPFVVTPREMLEIIKVLLADA